MLGTTPASGTSACELAERIRAEWRKLGCPLTAEGGATGRAVVTHALVLLLQNADRDAQRFSPEVAVLEGSAISGRA